ncbi:MAG: hypothetical protein ACP5NF_10025, partial [Thermoanaerobaculum sp.]
MEENRQRRSNTAAFAGGPAALKDRGEPRDAAEESSYTLQEEIAHSAIHGLGVILAIAALAVMVGFAARFGTARHIVGASIFGASLVLA